MVLPDEIKPYLLARVRWPDVAQAISAGRPDWQEDPGLFDLPYDPSSVTVTRAEATSIAEAWGADIDSDTALPALSLIRRMPANWSNLVPAEKRAWSLEYVTGRHRPAPRPGRLRSHFRTREPSQQTTRLIGLPAMKPRLAPIYDSASRSDSSPATVATERRGYPRVPVQGRAQISSYRKAISAHLVDLSQSGVNCVVPDARSLRQFGLNLDSPVVLESGLSGSRIRLDVNGRIVWRRNLGPGIRLGIVFGELNNDQAEQVRQFLVNASAHQES
ncbi:MAG: PilZ domain-containing protein [Acidimicrobiales bacterium]|jgi:hypothetical protein